MRDEKKKFEIAKKNYEEFWNKMKELSKDEDESSDMIYPSYLTTQDDEFIIDYHWSDEKISPTALIKWIKSYNKRTNKRKDWITQAELHPDLIEQLDDMYESFNPPEEIEGVIIKERLTTS